MASNAGAPPLIVDPSRLELAARLADGKESPLLPLVDAYLERLADWNLRTNLVSRRLQPGEVRSLALRAFLVLPLVFPGDGVRAIDAGAGAGMISLALAVGRPDLDVLSVELRRLRALFLDDVSRHLGLPRWRTQQINVAKLPRHCCDIAIAQALAAPAEALRLLEPAVASGGRIVLPTGDNADLRGLSAAPGWLIRTLPAATLLPGTAGFYVIADKVRKE